MLSENIKLLRKTKGLTQEELATKLGVVRQTVSKWEKGISVPDSEMLIEISEIFETPVSALLGETINAQEQEISVMELSNKLSLINEQLAANTEKKRKLIKAFSVIGVVGVIVYAIVRIITILGIKSALMTDDANMAIIGGADGPTAIFVTAYGLNIKAMIIAVIILIISIIGLCLSRKRR